MTGPRQKNNSTSHPIQVASRRTGLTPEVLRVWEKRYGAVRPARTPSGRRAYSDADIEHLKLLRQATKGGRRISEVAPFSTEQLEALVHEDRQAEEAAKGASREGSAPAVNCPFVDQGLVAISQMDPQLLEQVLLQAATARSGRELIEEVLAPMMRKIGDLWYEGRLTPGHEHLASAVVARLLGSFFSLRRVFDSTSVLIVATPSGQRHEIGAMLAAATAASEGWTVVYLGPDLPAEHIAAIAQRRDAAAVALSLVYPQSDPRTHDDLRKLHRLLPDGIAILVGGTAVSSYQETLDEINAVQLADTHALRSELAHIRTVD